MLTAPPHFLMRRLCLLIAAFLCLCVTAQKPLKNIAALLKGGKAQEALTAIEQCTHDTLLREKPVLYQYGVQACQQLCDKANERLYLKQKIDTAQLFSTIYGLYEYALRTDSLERHTSRKPKYHKTNIELLTSHYPNLRAASAYFLQRKDYAAAQHYANCYFAFIQDSIWGSNTMPAALEKDQTLVARCHLLSSMQLRDYASTFRYADLALRDTASHSLLTQQLVIAADNMGDSLRAYHIAQDGLAAHPDNSFFYRHITRYMLRHDAVQEALMLTDSLLSLDSLSISLHEGKAALLFHQENYDDCIAAANTLLRLNPAHVRAHYLIGASYCRKAQNINLPDNIKSRAYKNGHKQRQALYEKARTHMETFRQLSPDKISAWGPYLYTIYLHLNMGKEFEEINHLIE